MDRSSRRPGTLRRSRAGTGGVRSTLAEAGPRAPAVLSVFVAEFLGFALDGTWVPQGRCARARGGPGLAGGPTPLPHDRSLGTTLRDGAGNARSGRGVDWCDDSRI